MVAALIELRHELRDHLLRAPVEPLHVQVGEFLFQHRLELLDDVQIDGAVDHDLALDRLRTEGRTGRHGGQQDQARCQDRPFRSHAFHFPCSLLSFFLRGDLDDPCRPDDGKLVPCAGTLISTRCLYEKTRPFVKARRRGLPSPSRRADRRGSSAPSRTGRTPRPTGIPHSWWAALSPRGGREGPIF